MIAPARIADRLDEPSVLDGASREVVASTSAVLEAVRVGGCASRSEVVERTGLGRASVTQRVRVLVEEGVLREGGLLHSSGGRPAQRLEFAADRGCVIGVEIGMTRVEVSGFDLAGVQLASTHHDVAMRHGPDAVLSAVEELVDGVHADIARDRGAVLCGIGVGVAGPVEFATGRTVHPPVHPDWHDQPIRDRLEERFGAGVWVDNEVNLMALAELRRGAAAGLDDVLVFKLGSWVGAGLVSGGRLHRGAQGCAGSLVTTAGGDAIASEAQRIAASGASPGLADALREGRRVDARAVSELAAMGDHECRALLDSAAEDIGRVMAVVVDFFNPSLVVVAGGVTHGGDAFLAKVRETVYGSALALATRDLRIVRSTLDGHAGVIGAALMTLDELFAVDRLPRTLAVLRSGGTRP